MSSFGIAVREARLRMNLSLRQLGSRIGKTASYLSRIENTLCPPPSAEVVKLLANELDEDYDRFLLLARRIDPEIKAKAAEILPKIEDTMKLMTFLDKSIMRNEDDPLGGIQGIMEFFIADSLLTDRKMNSLSTFKFFYDMLKELSEHESDDMPKSYLIKREIGALVLSSASSLAEDGLEAADYFSSKIRTLIEQLKDIESAKSLKENNGTT